MYLLRAPQSPSDGLPALCGVQPPHVTPEARRWAIFWMVAIGGLGVLDGWRATKHDGSTVSELTRAAFAVDTPRGRQAFGACWGLSYSLFSDHILHR